MNKTGTEALGSAKDRKPKHDAEKDKKGKSGKSEHKGLKLAEIRTKPLADGTFHHEHHMEDAKGIPHHKTFGYSSATKDDAADHMLEHLPEAPQGAQDAGEPDGDEGAAAAAQQATSQPPAAAAPQE